MVARELHDDGSYSDKVFAPGYGEFFTGHKGEVEALALAVPTDALGGPVPVELKRLSHAAARALHATRSGRWGLGLGRAQYAHRAPGPRTGADLVPPRLAAEMKRALRTLRAAIGPRGAGACGERGDRRRGSRRSTSNCATARLSQVDLGRFKLWAEQVLVDAAAGDVGGVRGDVTTMEWIRDRFEACKSSPPRT